LPLKCGDTFLIPKNARATEHLWVIVTEIDVATNKAICVNITARQSHSETTCILKPGDHSFIRHESVINFPTCVKCRSKIDAAPLFPQSPFLPEPLKQPHRMRLAGKGDLRLFDRHAESFRKPPDVLRKTSSVEAAKPL
jgi:hypothetical protein